MTVICYVMGSLLSLLVASFYVGVNAAKSGGNVIDAIMDALVPTTLLVVFWPIAGPMLLAFLVGSGIVRRRERLAAEREEQRRQLAEVDRLLERGRG